jgi:hypothetical protein
MGGGLKIFSRLRRSAPTLRRAGRRGALSRPGPWRAPGYRAPPDEVDEVGEPALLGGELSLLQLERVGEMGAQFGDLFLDAAERVGDVLRIGDLLLDRAENDLLHEGSADEHLVVARALRGGQATVVAAALTAHLGDGGSARVADHGAS